MPILFSVPLPPDVWAHAQADPLCRELVPTIIGRFLRHADHQAIRAHPRDDAILIHVEAGCGWYARQLDGPTTSLVAGDMLIVPPDAPHRYGAERHDPWTISWCHVGGGLAECIAPRIDAGWHARADQRSAPLWQDLMHVYSGVIDVAAVRRASALVRLIIANQEQFSATYEQPFATVLAAMDEQVHDHLDLDDLASIAGLSRHHFSRRFRAHYGLPPHRYFLMVKMRHAARDLDRSDESIAIIAARYGYEDQFYFSRLFKRIVGYAPRDYRLMDKG